MSITTQITALQADKTAIESAITAKGGTLSQDSGFDTFASDITSIPSGGGIDSLSDYISGALQEYTYTGNTAAKELRFFKIPSIRFSNLAVFPAYFLNNASINYIYAPQATKLETYACAYIRSLTETFFPKVDTIGNYAFRGTNDTGTFTKICFPCLQSIPMGAFFNRTFLSQIVLGLSSVVSLLNTNAFGGTPFDLSGIGGTVYVPHTQITVEGQTMWLKDAYAQATNWSALNCTFKEIAETSFSGDGSTTTFTLSDNNAHPDDVFYIKIGNDFPEFTYDSTTGVITFATAPASGTNNINVYFKGVEVT